jgi:hypothetical protein
VALEPDPSHRGHFVLAINATVGTGRFLIQALQHGKVLEVSVLPAHGGRARRLGQVRAKNVDRVVVFGKARVQEQGVHLPITFQHTTASNRKTTASVHHPSDAMELVALDAALAEWRTGQR